MIQLKNVSKFYYSKGMIASGISKINLEFGIGEFVVITGESGSGKSTLLNVISGLDTYEEGEMYINGRETSHYLASDFEEYRKKYIGNIFQSFNLVNSYTVYQNIELILRINGYRKADMKQRIRSIIKRVGLEAYTGTKVSKLSGGQKQRVAIARALAKDTDIIVADEPTGNLDSRSAQGIAALLSEISRDKLVIVVTHNYEQFAPYATRQIRMHDGKVAEDNIIRRTVPVQPSAHSAAGRITVGSKLRLGMRNTFNIVHKFLLLLIVFIFVVTAVTAQYTTYRKSDEETSKLGYNDIFMNYSPERIILKKNDGSTFKAADYRILRNLDNIKDVAANDILLDSSVYLEDNKSDFYYDAYPRTVDEFSGKLVLGRMPEKKNEVILAGVDDGDYFSKENLEKLVDRTFKVYVGDEDNYKIKIVGFAYKSNDGSEYVTSGDLFVTKKLMSKMRKGIYSSNSTVTTTINGKAQEYMHDSGYYKIISNSSVAKGSALMPEEANNFFEKYDAKGKDVTITAKNIFYKKTIRLVIGDLYTEKNFTEKTGKKDFEYYNGAVFVNPSDYSRLFAKGNYQTSVFLKSVKDNDLAQTESALEAMGYTILPLKDLLVTYGGELLSIVQVPMVIIVIIALFFIAYFVIRLILRSRTGYFSILRMLGLSRKDIRRVLDIEMFTVVNIAFAVFLAVVMLAHYHIINVEYIWSLAEYMRPVDYVLLYVVAAAMAYLISGKFIRSIFRKSAMGSFREEGR